MANISNSRTIGEIKLFPVDDVPDHCLECNGAVISRTTYSELFAVLGTVYGEGDGTSTFKLPDFRDRFLRGAGGTNAAAIGTAQDANVGAHAHTVLDQSYESVGEYRSDSFIAHPGAAGNSLGAYQITTYTNPTGETIPMNYAVKYCIIFE